MKGKNRQPVSETMQTTHKRQQKQNRQKRKGGLKTDTFNSGQHQELTTDPNTYLLQCYL